MKREKFACNQTFARKITTQRQVSNFDCFDVIDRNN